MRDGPLDMRMDTTSGETAAEWIARAEEQEIREVIWRHGEERFAKQVAGAIVAARSLAPIETTRQLAEVVGRAVRTREPGQNPATRTFQALRIHVNRELEELEVTLPQAVEVLEPQGGSRDQLPLARGPHRQEFPARARRRPTSCRRTSRCARRDIPPAPIHLVGKAIKPGEAEIRSNPRARSAVLRVAEKN
jgi:16S rRNA (cytosine1402-N4)-methyltransferase